jgi:hypothetical protein
MINYDENDLIHDDYVNTTTKGDNPNYTAIRDRERVSKKELYEVVWFCDAFVKNHPVAKTKESFRKVEKLLRLPQISHIVMRDELNDFVAKNWNAGLV